MAFRTTAEEMERLQLSDDDTEDLWNSPSKRVAHEKINPRASDEKTTPEPRASHDGEDPLFDDQEAREAALRTELQGVRNINEVIEGLLESLESAKGNMEVMCLPRYSMVDPLANYIYRRFHKLLLRPRHSSTRGLASFPKPSIISD
jgi:hypothetical protein